MSKTPGIALAGALGPRALIARGQPPRRAGIVACVDFSDRIPLGKKSTHAKINARNDLLLS